jgi:hypothetical protein
MKFRDFAIGLFFVTLTAILLFEFPAINQAINSLAAAASEGKQAMVSVRKMAEESRAFTKDQQEKLNDEKTQAAIGLYLRGGKEFYRALLRVNSILEHTDQITVHAQTVTLPAVDDTARTAAATVKDIGSAGSEALRGVEKTTEGAALVTSDVEKLFSSGRIPSLLDRSTQTLEDYGQLAQEARSTLAITNQRLPTTLDHANEILANVSGITFKVDAYAGRALKPQTIKERIAIEAGAFLLKQVPFITTVLFKR